MKQLPVVPGLCLPASVGLIKLSDRIIPSPQFSMASIYDYKLFQRIIQSVAFILTMKLFQQNYS